MSETTTNARVLNGVISSLMGTNAVVVKVSRSVVHPRYQKRIKSTKKYYAACESTSCKIGDSVSIAASRPISKLIRWKVIKN